MAKIVKIEELLGRSKDRFLTADQLEADPALVAEGWERRFTADAQRTAEVVELYGPSRCGRKRPGRIARIAAR